MNRQQILDLYEWSLGICFRHPGKGEVPTIHVKTIRPQAGGRQDVRACAECVLALEETKAAAAARRGRPYEPGLVADDDEDS